MSQWSSPQQYRQGDATEVIDGCDDENIGGTQCRPQCIPNDSVWGKVWHGVKELAFNARTLFCSRLLTEVGWECLVSR